MSYVKMFIDICGHAQQWVRTTTNAVVSLPYKVTGVICRVVTPKDKERYSSLLTKQNTHELGLYVGLSHLQARKEIQVLLQSVMKKKTNVIHRSKYKMKYYLLCFH